MTRDALRTSTTLVGPMETFRGGVLLHPVALAAIAMLLFNDHFLKARFPGLLTGKLSDFAGLVYFPLLLFTLLEFAWRTPRLDRRLEQRSLLGCVVLTGVVFSFAKTTDYGAETYRFLWAALQWPARALIAQRWLPLGTVQYVADPTDLVALPMLRVSLAIGRRVTQPIETGANRTKP